MRAEPGLSALILVYARWIGFIRARSGLCALDWFYPRSLRFMRVGLVLSALTLINERISITCFVV